MATLSALDVNLAQPEKWGDLGVDSNPQKLGNNQQKSVENGDWLVVLTILKNISQWEGLSHILWKIKNVPNHQPVE